MAEEGSKTILHRGFTGSIKRQCLSVQHHMASFWG